MQNLTALSDEALGAQAREAALAPLEARARCGELVRLLLVQAPERLAAVAETLLTAPGAQPGDQPFDDTADGMMEANPRLFEAPVAAAAEASQSPLARFRLTRAVFRRFPGRYRERMLEVGREALRVEEAHAPEVAVWMVRKFGAELVPDLVGLMRRPGAQDTRVPALQEAVKILGPGALAVVEAARGTGCEALERAAQECLHRLGMEPADAP